jgi:hypothetical protein
VKLDDDHAYRFFEPECEEFPTQSSPPSWQATPEARARRAQDWRVLVPVPHHNDQEAP